MITVTCTVCELKRGFLDNDIIDGKFTYRWFRNMDTGERFIVCPDCAMILISAWESGEGRCKPD